MRTLARALRQARYYSRLQRALHASPHGLNKIHKNSILSGSTAYSLSNPSQIKEFWRISMRTLSLSTAAANSSDQAPVDAGKGGPLYEYERRISSGELVDGDSFQIDTLQLLQILYDQLVENEDKCQLDRYKASEISGRSRWLWSRLIPQSSYSPVKGLYLYGGVGTGKTMLMDLFYDQLPSNWRKKRIHFHDFMLSVHSRLQMHKGVADPLEVVAGEISDESILLCLDEFMVNDVADALILNRLCGHLFSKGVVLVSTSNRAPDNLYEGGLQRDLFLPFIATLKERCFIHAIGSSTDYRKMTSAEEGFYFVGHEHSGLLKHKFHELIVQETPVPQVVEVVMGRQLQVPLGANGCAYFPFEELCDRPLGAADYFGLFKKFHTLALEGVPKFGLHNRTAAYRFVTLVDVMYENKSRFLCTAETSPVELFERIVTVADAQKVSPRTSSRSQKKDDLDLCVDNELGFARDRTISRMDQQSFRKALGALKDSTTVGLAKVNSDYKELNIAIVKATNHVEVLAKEKHIRTIFSAISASRPRADVAYCINALARRLAKTHNWAVAIKTLIVVHRALREVDATFREELINYTRTKSHMLNLSHFKDDSTPNAWDYSAWLRTYALYLEERLECVRVLKYDVETDHARTSELDTFDLLEHLPALQQLLFRLLACQPEGAVVYNSVIRYALSTVASESIKIYNAINGCTLNLVDKFFEMQRHDALRALEIYRKAGYQAERLSGFCEICKGLDLGREGKFVKIEQPPLSFITAMEEYVKDASRTQPANMNVAGGLDKLTLDSLYDNAISRRGSTNGNYHLSQVAPNPFEDPQFSQDPFYASNITAAPANVQIKTMAQQQAFMMQGQLQQQPMGQDSTNPFGNPFGPTSVSSYPSHNPYAGFM